MGIEEELQAAEESGSLVIGTEETLKELESLETIVLASNAPLETEEEVAEQADEAGVEVHRAEADNRQLGSMCMKPFSASVVGIK